MARTTMIINFSASPSLAKMVAQQAAKEQRSKSELLRDAFGAYLFDQRLKKLQETGKILAQKLGLDSYDEIEEYVG